MAACRETIAHSQRKKAIDKVNHTDSNEMYACPADHIK